MSEATLTNNGTYDLRVTGLREPPGRIKAATLHRLIGALLQAAERATRLAVTGEGMARGKRPAWLEAALDFTIGAPRVGSTVLRFEAPRLSEAAPEQFAVPSLWGQTTPSEATAFDLVAEAIRESQSSRPSGERFDPSVLNAVVEVTNAARSPAVRCELIPARSPGASFALDAEVGRRIQKLLDAIPAPQTAVVAGRLDAIKHEGGRFQIVLDQGERLPGRLDPEELDKEVLRPLWGRPATVLGTVRFRPNGRPQFIEARRITAHHAGDRVFTELPEAEPGRSRTLFARPSSSRDFATPRDLVGAWPGDEPIEELLAELD